MKIVLPLFLLLLSGCATTGGFSHTGFAIINNHKEAGFAASDVPATKTGRACSENFLGVVTLGNSSLEEAMKVGGIEKVSTVDYDYFKAIFYGRFCVIVRGS